MPSGRGNVGRISPKGVIRRGGRHWPDGRALADYAEPVLGRREAPIRVLIRPAALGAYRFTMKVREVIRMLEEDGWYLADTRGSHRQYKHPAKAGRVTVAGKLSDDLAPGTLNSIRKQAGLKETR